MALPVLLRALCETRLVLDHRDALAVVLGQDVVEQSGLARTQEAGDDLRGGGGGGAGGKARAGQVGW